MTKLLSLDLSTKTGYALFEYERDTGIIFLKKSGTLFLDKTHKDFGQYPFSYVDYAEFVVNNIFEKIKELEFAPDEVVIEETTASQNNYSQKILEYIHFLVNKGLRSRNIRSVYYVRTGVWRNVVGAKASSEDKKLNSKIARIKKKENVRLAKIDGKVVGKKDKKDYAIRAVKEIFNLEFKKKNNDEVDAILLGYAFTKGASICDGTLSGGSLGSK